VNELALFAGAGGGILGGHLLGWKTVCAVEIEDYPRRVLLARQRDGILPRFPIWDDIKTFDGNPWRGKVDVVSGGFPCQDISAAGKGAGIRGERSGMWAEMARVVSEVRPRYVFVENSPMLTSRGLGVVLGDLFTMGYDARWGVLGARHVGAPHKRDRIWIMAYTYVSGGRASKCKNNKSGSKIIEKRQNQPQFKSCRSSGIINKQPQSDISNTICKRGCGGDSKWEYAKNARQLRRSQRQNKGRVEGWNTEPRLGRVANGVANRVDRLKAIGNGQVPAVAALAWQLLTQDTQP